MAGGHGHGALEGANKTIAIVIALLAALLALCEASGKAAQTKVLQQHIEASNLWAFFQAKTIRQTTVRTATEAMPLLVAEDAPAPARERLERQVQAWRQLMQRWETEPETNEGRRELMVRARAAETARDKAEQAYHMFEYGSASLQLAIVLVSASIVTGVALLAWFGGGLGVVGFVFLMLGWFAPTLIHF